MALIGDIGKALAQIFDRPFLGVLLTSLLLTVLLLIGTTIGLVWTVAGLVPNSITLPWIGTFGEIDMVAAIASIPILLFLSAFVMFPVAGLFVGLFLDRIAGAVEARHYSYLPPAREISLSETIWDGIKLALLILVANLLAMIVYLFSFAAAPFVFWAVNGILIGREYFQQVAMRRLDPAEAKALRQAHRGRIWFAGMLMAVPLSVPVVNLLVPLVGVATFTHQFHRLNGTAR